MCCVYGDTALLLLWCTVNLVIRDVRRLSTPLQHLGDGCCQGGLAMVHMSNGPNITVNEATLVAAEESDQCCCLKMYNTGLV